MKTFSLRGLLTKALEPKLDSLSAQVELSVAKVDMEIQLQKGLIDLITAQRKLEKQWQDLTHLCVQIAQHARVAQQIQDVKTERECLTKKAQLDSQLKEIEQHLTKIVEHCREFEVKLLGQASTPPWTPPALAVPEVAKAEPAIAAVPIVTTRTRPSALAERLVLA